MRNPNQFQQDPDNTMAAMQGHRPDVTRSFATVAGELAGVAERSGSFIKEQAHQGLSEFVSRVLGLNEKVPEPGKEKAVEQDPGHGMDR